jgi:outer membrane protein assembly factor BamE (lipoprotein component of BamABCDE complex)
MKTLAVVTALTVCLAGLSGCVTPTHSYNEIHTHNWTRESMEQRFPAGTSKAQVLDKLGSPFAVNSSGDVSRWDYVGGASGQLHVVFLFKNGNLVEKRFENF